MVRRVLPDGTVVDVPQTGLIGSEQALQGGLQGALGAIGRGAQIARGDIGQTQQFVGQQIEQGIAGGAQAFGRGVSALDPFAQPGAAAFQQQANLAGAGGPGAQAAAFQAFRDSPGQQFLQERGERALVRNQGRIGGLGGGNVRSELQRQGIGFAQQDFANQFNRLGSLSQIGAGAASQQAGLFGQQAGQVGQLRAGQAGITSQLGQVGAGIAQRAGEFGGQAILGTGQQLAGGRTRAGENIATATGATGSALANLVAAQGAGVSDILASGTGSLANLLTGAGQAGQLNQQQLATLLANISTGSASQQAALPSLPGLAPKTGILSDVIKLGQAAGTAIGASDIRLKKNITKVGQTNKGINLYTWDWNKIGRKITGQLSGFGVIAQELKKIMPEAVIDGPYLRVDYGKVF